MSPGAVETELTDTITDEDLQPGVGKLYEQAIPAEDIARAIRYAVKEPDSVALNEVLVRPTSQQ